MTPTATVKVLPNGTVEIVIKIVLEIAPPASADNALNNASTFTEVLPQKASEEAYADGTLINDPYERSAFKIFFDANRYAPPNKATLERWARVQEGV
jgi:hypothetical protein